MWSIRICAAAKSLQSCPTLCDPIDGSPPGSPIPGILQARRLDWAAISFSSAWKWKVKLKSLSRVRLLATPWTAASRLLRPWDFPGKRTGVGCHCLLWRICATIVQRYVGDGMNKTCYWICNSFVIKNFPSLWIINIKRQLYRSLLYFYVICFWKIYVYVCAMLCCAKLLQLCLTLCDTMDCSPPGSSVHGIFLAGILEWVAIPFSRGSSWSRDRTCVSYISCILRSVLYH